ncbi:MAG: FAD-dependent oxidoreductase [Bacteroidetes bacterium]|nr:FAD-dependent oxidoreductase [Bacteroidota bacterium]
MNKTQKPVLVIGGGISGVTTAVEIAEVGKEVILIEKEPYLGGNVVKFNNYFPKLCPPTCGLEINFRRIKQNPRINYFTSTEVLEIAGEKGNFKAKLKTAPQYIKNNCTACGKCAKVCPEERPNDFNYGFTKTKAAYLPHEMAFPYKYVIDDEFCKKEACNKCAEVCEYDAINLSAKEEIKELEVSSVVVATGWKNYDASKIDNLNYSSSKNIITNVEFERFIASNGVGENKLLRLSDNTEPKKIAFVQCAGSRDENHLPYCSAVCCSASLKHALTIQELYPKSEIKIFYIDLRVSGRNEDFLAKVQTNKNIELVKGKVGKITETENNNLILEAEDILSGKKIKYEAELAVLATGIVPSNINIKLNKDSNQFMTDAQTEGIIPVACSRKPMDVSTSLKDATGAALKAIQ